MENTSVSLPSRPVALEVTERGAGLSTDPARTSLARRPLASLPALVLASYEWVRDEKDASSIVGALLGWPTERSLNYTKTILSTYSSYLEELSAGEQLAASECRRKILACFQLVQGEEGEGRRPAGPRSLTWIVTYECHLQCRYCYVHTTQARGAKDSLLSKDRVLEILKEAAQLGGRRLELRGGEPFLRRDLPAIITEAVQLGFAVDASTKLPLPAQALQQLPRSEAFHLGVSLDTTDPERGDPILGETGMTRRLQKFIVEASQRGIQVGIEATITSRTLNGISELLAFADAAGASHVHLREVAPHPRSDIGDLTLSPAETRDLRDWIATQGPRLSHTPAFRSIHHCDEGLHTLTFLPDGRVSKCTATLSNDPDMLYGDLTRNSILDVWNGPILQRLIARTRGIRPDGGSLPPLQGGFVPCSQIVLMNARAAGPPNG